MDRAISASEANQRFSELLRRVAQGESFTVTSRGRPVARMLPVESDDVAERRRKAKQLLDFVRAQPIRSAGPWTREELYERRGE